MGLSCRLECEAAVSEIRRKQEAGLSVPDRVIVSLQSKRGERVTYPRKGERANAQRLCATFAQRRRASVGSSETGHGLSGLKHSKVGPYGGNS